MDPHSASSSHEIVPVPPEAGQTATTDIENPAAAGSPTDLDSILNSVIKGDLEAMRSLIIRDRTLAWKETEDGRTALHLAVANEHTELVLELLRWVPPEALQTLDGDGYTACCYATMSGMTEAAVRMFEASPGLFRLESRYGTSPLTLAVSYGRVEIVSYLLTLDDIPQTEWFELLVLSIERKAFGVALKILEKDDSLGEMRGPDTRTALHVLAQINISEVVRAEDEEDLRVLVESLWRNIKRLGRGRAMELISTPSLLGDAAETGNVELIAMMTRSYPELCARPYPDGSCLLHKLVSTRNEKLLQVVERAKTAKDVYSIPIDREGNNILHEAAKSHYDDKELEIVGEQFLELRKAYDWFKAVEAIVPPAYLTMRNKKGFTPVQLFWKQHGRLAAKNLAHMKKRTQSYMIIATLMLSLVFTSAYAPPGGYNQKGVPVLFGNIFFKASMMFAHLASACALISLVGFALFISLTGSTLGSSIFTTLGLLEYSLNYLFSSAVCITLSLTFSLVLISVVTKSFVWALYGYALFFLVGGNIWWMAWMYGRGTWCWGFFHGRSS